MDYIAERYGCRYVVLDQCMYGCAARKRSGWFGRLTGLEHMYRKCNHRGKHPGSTANITDDKKRFLTKGLETYPDELCRTLAELYVSQFEAERHQPWHDRRLTPPPYFPASAYRPCGKLRRNARALAVCGAVDERHPVPVCPAASRHAREVLEGLALY